MPPQAETETLLCATRSLVVLPSALRQPSPPRPSSLRVLSFLIRSNNQAAAVVTPIAFVQQNRATHASMPFLNVSRQHHTCSTSAVPWREVCSSTHLTARVSATVFAHGRGRAPKTIVALPSVHQAREPTPDACTTDTRLASSAAALRQPLRPHRDYRRVSGMRLARQQPDHCACMCRVRFHHWRSMRRSFMGEPTASRQAEVASRSSRPRALATGEATARVKGERHRQQQQQQTRFGTKDFGLRWVSRTRTLATRGRCCSRSTVVPQCTAVCFQWHRLEVVREQKRWSINQRRHCDRV